jgi:hypothetical protein
MMREEDRHAADYCWRRIVKPRVGTRVLLGLDYSPHPRRWLTVTRSFSLKKLSWKLWKGVGRTTIKSDREKTVEEKANSTIVVQVFCTE